ncbi:MAG: hypothetical protein AAB619_02460 [Patescibacteria group bacterium]
MTYANVVPLRRLPPDRQWFTYRVPSNLKVAPGSLVTVPFRRQALLGVVWSLTDLSPAGYAIQPVSAVHLKQPVMTAWQRQTCQLVAATGATSLGDVLFGALPKLSLSTYQRLVNTDHAAVPATVTGATSRSFFWYRDRRSALEWISTWADRQGRIPAVVIVPTVQDAEEISGWLNTTGRRVAVVHAAIPPTTHAEVYRRVLSGQPFLAVGTLRALTLPFHGPPGVLLDQEEHHAHNQTAQPPRSDVRIVLESLRLPYASTTPAPRVSTVIRRRPVPPPPAGDRQLVSLDRPGGVNWITDEVAAVVDQALDRKHRIVCIAPRRGYASTTRCRSCGYVQTCPTCQRRVALFRGTVDEAICRYCRQTVSLHLTCPRCRNQEWSVQGLGLEQVAAVWQRRWPSALVAPVVNALVPADIAVDSYLAYHQLRGLPQLGPVVIICGDSLLNLPDYATSERAWQFLARLQAEHPAVPIIVQTFNPDHVFWQRWLHSDDQAWYKDEIAERKRLRLPPFAIQWIARNRESLDEVEQTRQRLTRSYPAILETRLLPPLSRPARRATHRLLLSFATAAQARRFPWRREFPPPWQVDQYPQSWLD